MPAAAEPEPLVLRSRPNRHSHGLHEFQLCIILNLAFFLILVRFIEGVSAFKVVFFFVLFVVFSFLWSIPTFLLCPSRQPLYLLLNRSFTSLDFLAESQQVSACSGAEYALALASTSDFCSTTSLVSVEACVH